MESQSTNNSTRTESEDQSQTQQQRAAKKKTNKDKGVGQADYYYQFVGFEFESSEPKNYQTSKPKKYSQTALKNFKKSYMQGNFRFLMSPSYEQEPRFFPPDQNIPWDCVEQVKYITNLNIHCPICLNELDGIVAPQITRCGHIYCWPCILSSKCPLCSDLVLEKDLKSADVKWVEPVAPGEPFKLKLMKRNKNDYAILEPGSFEENHTFSRIKKLTYQQIADIRRREIQIMQEFLTEFSTQEDEKEHLPFISAAITKAEELLKLAENKCAEMPKISKERQKINAYNYSETTEDDFFYFYQESNGLNIFLNPTSYKFLKNDYLSYSEMPFELESNFIDMEGFQQNEKTRKRFKHLGHIPLNSDIKFVSIEMYPFLSFDKLLLLDDELKSHKEKSQPKEPEEPPQRKKTSSKTSPNSFPLSQSDLYAKFTTTPSLKELKLDDASDYPELPATDSNTMKKYNEQVESLQSKIDEKKKLAEKEKEKEKELVKKNKVEEFKSTDDYVVKESDTGAALSDFIFVRTTKQKKNKTKSKQPLNLATGFE